MKANGHSLLREWDGPLTRDLVLQPAAFGLGRLPARLHPDATTASICGFCSTGCGLDIHLRGGEAINLTANAKYPVNLGMACPKGWEALSPLAAPDRGTTPLLRNSAGKLEAVDWDMAMQVFALRIRGIQDKFGAESTAWLGTGQIMTEELALLGALCKFGLGMIHGDGNTRQVAGGGRLEVAPERRLFEDGRFYIADGKACFIFEQPRSLPEPADSEYPFTLLTGRGTSVQWHTGTRTEKSAVLRKLRPESAYVEINPDDARRLGIRPKSKVRVSSRRGGLIAKAFVTAAIQRGQLFIPMHYAQVNGLTFPAFDPYSRQPSYKACAVCIDKISAHHL
ncbi:MAG TPA: molybdopterin oxidoreductase family protein [Verrucomicrobiae bacterium]